MQRFFIAPETLEHDPVVLSGPVAHQLCHVLRLQPGTRIALLDDTGWQYTAELLHVTPQRAEARILSRQRPQTEPSVHITLYQALVVAHKLEWVLQKGTELGVSAFVPLVTARSLPARAGASKLARWQRIVTEASEQSGRVRRPRVESPRALTACLPVTADLALLGAVDDRATPLSAVLEARAERPRTIALFIGPEGGLAPDEIEAARASGIHPISLGPRTLRTETAGLAAVAALMYALGEWQLPALDDAP